MNILLLTDLFPYPVNHGEPVVSFNWARELIAKGHNVKLLSLQKPGGSAEVLVMEEMGIEVIQTGKAYRHNDFPLRWLTTRLPMAILRVSIAELLPDVEHIADKYAIEVIVLISASLATLPTLLDESIPTVIVPIDSISLVLRRRKDHTKSLLRKAYIHLEISKWEFIEAEYCSKAASCIVVTDSDATNLSKRWPAPAKDRIAVITNGVDTEYFKPDPEIPEVANKLVFTGVMRVALSVVSMEWFLENVYPLLKARWNDLSMDIVGREPAQRLVELAAMYKDIHVVGEVPDIRPYMDQAAIYVAPMILGSGVNNRVLEAMAMGKAVVATPYAAGGIDDGEGETPLVIAAAEAPQFARRISELLANSELRRSVGARARQFVIENHSWSTAGSALDGILRDVV